MKGSDKLKMTINIGGELIQLDIRFDEQNEVRDVEQDIKLLYERISRSLPENYSEKQIFARTIYQYASWYHKLLKIQQETIDIATKKSQQIDNFLNEKLSEETDIDMVN